jgi:hypothetical protein
VETHSAARLSRLRIRSCLGICTRGRRGEYKERVKESECGGNTKKMEKWDLLKLF